MRPELSRRLVAEAVGSALLLAVVVGSGIMAERLAGKNVALALLANTLATGAGLVALILTFASISGAHFNPAVSLSSASQGALPWREVPWYTLAQVLGAFIGTAVAHVMFAEPLFSRLWTLVSDCSAVRRRGVHHVGVLVHGLDVIRQSGGHAGARGHRHVHGDSSRGRPRIHRSAAAGRNRGHGTFCVAHSGDSAKDGRRGNLADR
jgi:hypothetical protein